MSLFQFLASNKILEEVNNPHVELISINEAVERNIMISDFILNNKGINKDERIIMVCDSEELFNELEIKNDMYYSSEYSKEYSEKQYFSELKWNYSETRAKQLIDYLTNQLKNVDEIEIWSIWLDDYQPATIRRVKMTELAISDLEFLNTSEGFDYPKCLVVTK